MCYLSITLRQAITRQVLATVLGPGYEAIILRYTQGASGATSSYMHYFRWSLVNFNAVVLMHITVLTNNRSVARRKRPQVFLERARPVVPSIILHACAHHIKAFQ